jgi:hypothetical protein
LAEAEGRARRILVTIALDSPNCLYTQGQDRFVWVSYLVSLSFAAAGGLPLDFAEAMAFNLGRTFILRNEIARQLENFPAIEHHFLQLDELVRREEPRVATYLQYSCHSSVHYALKWQLTFFADEHNAYELLFLWDQILAREADLDGFIRCLCVGHLRQVPIPVEPDEMALTIQRHKNWDVVKILDDAIELMGKRDETTCRSCLSAVVYVIDFLFQYRQI